MSNQVLLRLPDDLAARFAQVVAPRQRGRFLIDLLRRELERESSELKEAAKRLTEIEAGNPILATEEREWLDTPLAADADEGFDADLFESQYREAKVLHETGKTRTAKAA
jgi:predicted transcriptional regulator